MFRSEIDENEEPRRHSLLRRALPLLLMVALLTGFFLAHRADGPKLARALEHASPWWLAVAFAIQVLRYVCAGQVWRVALRQLGVRLRSKTMIRLAVERIYFDQLIPAAGLGGSAINIRTLKRSGVPAADSTTAFLADVVSDYIVYALCAAACLLVLWVRQDLNQLVAVTASFFTLIVIAVLAAVVWIVRHRDWCLPPRLARFEKLRRAMTVLRELDTQTVSSPRLLTRLTGWQLALYLLDGATLDVALRALGVVLDPGAVYCSFIVAKMAGTLAIVPGGLGTFDAAAVAMLTMYDVPLGAALAAVILYRGFTLWLPLIPGAFLARHHFGLGGEPSRSREDRAA